MADAITHAKVKTVVVLDFVGPNNRMTELGQKLADDFSSDLAKSKANLAVQDCAQLREALRKNYIAPDEVKDSKTDSDIARVVKAQVFITGKLSTKNGDLVVETESHQTGDGSSIKRVKVIMPLTQEMNALMNKIIEEGPLADFPEPEQKGYSSPVCLNCPPAEFSGAAIAAKVQGKVVLNVVVGVDGRAHDVRIVKALPSGLTERAIKAVQGWKFKPATGPDGKPAPVRQIIVVTFHLT
jgi:TonB family protein